MVCAESAFAPPLSFVRRAAAADNKRKAPSLTPLQHSVITFGSHRNAPYLDPLSTIVEGTRTGEVRVVDSGGKRRSQDEFLTEQKKIRQLGAELQRAVEKLRIKNDEGHKLRRKAAMVQLQLGEEVERRTYTAHNLLELMEMQGTCMRAINAELRRLLQAAWEERDTAVRNFGDERAARVSDEHTQKKINTLQIENDDLRQQLEEARRAKGGLEEACERLQGEKEGHETNFAKLRQKLELDLMRTQAQLQGVNKDLAEARSTMKESDALLQQVRLFIQMICQPDFYVVRDRSLEPVDKNRPGPTGFVLVPLTVLLQGYTLLSPSCRQNVIDSYRAQLS
ncbi:hypothetical protein TRSC58_02810 [Trypanosoma rangeli SC58]|uniref:Uncharacterized protein n=1 Tax=Trypanosoma rangeli SC58 TaxID=429131 RepID=A0A061J837_TRYRA|nr:hypothetical protein TRSC58_02810 [Trypanosoma rangeli SC58]